MSFEEKYGKKGDKPVAPMNVDSSESPDEEQLIKLVCGTVFKVVVVIFLVIGGCTAHSNLYDGDRLLAEAELEKARAIIIRASNEADVEAVKAIERLIKNGTDPVLARCAIRGYTTNNSRCKVIAPTGVESNESQATKGNE